MTRRILGTGAAWMVALVLTTAAPIAAQAQEHDAVTSAAPQAQAAQVQPAGPEMQPAPAGTDANDPARLLRPSAADARLLAPAPVANKEQRELVHQPAYYRRAGVPLMIIGGAMFLAGAIIDDRAGDAVMVAGVVVAAVGLYEYLQ